MRPRTGWAWREWLFSPQHPLTARVAVNRYWQLYFGTGLVKTTEDFGSQGDAPIQRELLDWLATEFETQLGREGDAAADRYVGHLPAVVAGHARSCWRRIRRIGCWRAVRASGCRPRWSATTRWPRAACCKRRSAARASIPYQPAGLWEELSRGETFTAQEYHESTGADLYRRSMYTFWKRTVPPAALTTFDAPDREKCTSRRLITNTPLQALVLLNDPTYVEAARALAQRAILKAGRDPQMRIALPLPAGHGAKSECERNAHPARSGAAASWSTTASSRSSRRN